MPRKPQPAHLWLRPGDARRGAVWCIVDGGRRYSTGCLEPARGEAEARFAAYLADKHEPAAPRQRRPAEVLIADVLSVYADDVVPRQARPKQAAERLARLAAWWGRKTLAEVSPATCRAYADDRRKAEAERRARERRAPSAPKPKAAGGGSRRDLEDLRAAINHHARRGLHLGHVAVELPAKGTARGTWFTRDEIARLLWACWRHGRTVRLPRGKARGALVESEWHDLRHIARFVLMAVYTGSRSGAVFSASIHAGAGRSWVDLDSGLFYRLAEGRAKTAKRQPTVRLPPRLLAHIRRWTAKGIIASHIVEWQGLPVASIKVGWARALRLAGIDRRATPHSLRHTAATWLMANGTPIWTAADYLGMSEAMVRRVYGHHHPDHQREAVEAITAKTTRRR